MTSVVAVVAFFVKSWTVSMWMVVSTSIAGLLGIRLQIGVNGGLTC